jgi:hypothetical protein
LLKLRQLELLGFICDDNGHFCAAKCETLWTLPNLCSDLGIFFRETAAPLLGGDKYAHDYLKYARLVGGLPSTDGKPLPTVPPKELKGDIWTPWKPWKPAT